MSQLRIYLPVTRTHLDDLASGGDLGPVPLTAYAVTEKVRGTYGAADEEELEYAALGDAHDAATAARQAGQRIVIAAADVDDANVLVDDAIDSASQITVTAPIPRRRIMSFHVEEDPSAADEELLWYDVTELGEVTRLAAT